MKPKLTDTLEQAKQYTRKHWQEGVRCPCCNQLVKLYKRPLYGTIAVNLIRLYKLSHRDFHHITKILLPNSSGGGDFAKLIYWGLVEEQPKDPDDPTARTSGMWRITQKGIDFVTGNALVYSHALIYDGQFLGMAGKEVGIKEILGKKFNYEELMNDIA